MGSVCAPRAAALALAAAVLSGVEAARAQSSPPPAGPGAARLRAMKVPFEAERFVQFAGQGDVTVVEAFLEAGLPPDAREPRRGATALIHAAANGHVRIVTRLLDAGASAAHADQGGTTALGAAAYFGKVTVVETLLARGADARFVPEGGGPSVLDAAIWGGDARIVKALLDAGADPVGSRREVPPLVRAAYAGRVEVLRLLLAAHPPAALLGRAREAAHRARHAEAEALLAPPGPR